MDNQILLLQEIRSGIWILVYLLSAIFVVNLLKGVASGFKSFKARWDDLFRCRAALLFDSGQYEKCIEFCNENLKTNPEKKTESAHAYWFLGKSFFQIKDYDRAVINFKKSVEIYPSWGESVDPFLRKIQSEGKGSSTSNPT